MRPLGLRLIHFTEQETSIRLRSAMVLTKTPAHFPMAKTCESIHEKGVGKEKTFSRRVRTISSSHSLQANLDSPKDEPRNCRVTLGANQPSHGRLAHDRPSLYVRPRRL